MKSLVALLFIASLTAAGAEELVKKNITYTVSHPMKTVTGTCSGVQVRGLSIQKANNVISTGSFQVIVPVSGMSTANRNRDSTMQTLFGYPANKEWIADIESLQVTGQTGTFRGILRLGEKKAPFDSPFQLAQEHGELTARGSLVVRLSDFQIERPRLLLLAVEDEVKINYEFSIQSPQ